MTKITIEIDTDVKSSILDARRVINSLLGIDTKTIEFDDPEPPSDTKWRDADGDIWHYNAGWTTATDGYSTGYMWPNHTDQNKSYFPMERVYD